MVAAEIEPQRLMSPPGVARRTPWHRADLAGTVDGEPVRVALDGALVDARAAREIATVTFAGPTGTRLTVLGVATRVPAEARAADPLCRHASMQARVSGSPGQPAVVFAGSREELSRRLRAECAMLLGALLVSVGAALLALS